MTNQVPWLRSGVGATPADGGCIMQVIDWIHRNEWTDQPPCVHPVLRRLAISANDTLDDVGRQKILDLVPRLMGTADVEKPVSVGLAVFCARAVLPLFEKAYPKNARPRNAIEAAEAWLLKQDASADTASAAANAAASAAAYAAAAAYASANAAAADAYTLLVGCLDEFDRLTGRTRTDEVDWAPVCEIMEVV